MPQLSTDLSTIPNSGTIAGFRKLQPATREEFLKPVSSSQELGLHYPESIAKSPNRKAKKKVLFPQFEEGEALETDKGLANHEDYFEAYIQETAPAVDPAQIYRCSKGFIWGESSQNNFYKMIVCGKEWCADCGKKHSIPHDRRINRKNSNGRSILENFLGLSQANNFIQYLVITIPAELRSLYRSKEALSRFRTYWKDKLKREGHQFGVSRYHYCGEDGYLWKPHLNILTPGGFVPKETLREWREELGRWFKMQHKLNYTPTANIYTSYTSEEGKIRHWLSYVMRATQVLYNKLNEETIKGFRNVAPWKDKDFVIPEYTREETERSAEEQAAAEGFDLLPDGTKEKIVWRMKFDKIKNRWRPDVVPVEQTRIDEMVLIRRGFWKEKKFIKPPDPGLPPPVICPF
jgi:hypothetical protein